MKYKIKLLLSGLIFSITILILYYNYVYSKFNSFNYVNSKQEDNNLKNRISELEIELNKTIEKILIPKIKPNPRIFCIIVTNRKNLDTKVKVVKDSWANRCDNYKFVSLFPEKLNLDHKTAEISYNNINILKPPGMIDDGYQKLTDKVFSAFKYVYNVYHDYDWYLKADDDSFIFVDNLRKFLSDKNSSNPVSYGYDFKVIVDYGYHSGGGSYLLSNNALKRIGQKLHDNYSFCPNTGTEDVDVAKCLRMLYVYPERSFDELGRERFHPLDMWSHYEGHFPDWMMSYSRNPVKKVKFLI